MNKAEKIFLWLIYLLLLLKEWLEGLMPKMTEKQKRAYLAGKAEGKKEQKKSSSRKANKKKK